MWVFNWVSHLTYVQTVRHTQTHKYIFQVAYPWVLKSSQTSECKKKGHTYNIKHSEETERI